MLTARYTRTTHSQFSPESHLMLAPTSAVAWLASSEPSAPASAAAIAPVMVIVALAVAVLVSIALDLRRLRFTAQLRTVHTVLGVAFTCVVVGGALTAAAAFGAAPSASAEMHSTDPPAPITEVPKPELIDTSDITDPTTDIQLPTLAH